VVHWCRLVQVIFQIPSNLLLVRFGARAWLPFIVLAWGAVAAAMSTMNTPVAFYVLRLLLGISVSVLLPFVARVTHAATLSA